MDDRPRQPTVPRDRFAEFAGKLLATLFFSLSFSAFANEPAHEWLRAQLGVVELAGKTDDLGTPFQQASEVLEALYAAGATRSELARIGASLRLDDAAGADTEYLARRIVAGIRLGENTSALTALLLTRQGSDGGFRPLLGYASTLLDTAFALRALATAGLDGRAESQSAATFLIARQDHDGGWSGAEIGANAHLTALVTQALWSVRNSISTSIAVQRAAAMLLAQRGSDGLWDETFVGAVALLALLPTLPSVDPVASSIDALVSRQSANGSWAESVYTTALAVRVLATAALPVPNPDLAVLRGSVVDGVTGEALSGASLSLVSDRTRFFLTEDNGAFELIGLEPGSEITLNVHHGGYVPLSYALDLDRGQLVDLGALPILRDSASAHASVQGVVSGALSGLPVAGATVRLEGAGGVVGTTDSAGYIELESPSTGEATLIVEAFGYETFIDSLRVTDSATAVFAVSLYPPGATPPDPYITGVAGTVLAPRGNDPLQGVLVVVSYGASHERVRTGLDGGFRITGLSSGTARLLIGGEGHEVLRYAVSLSPGRVIDLGVLRLPPQGVSVLLPDLEIEVGKPWALEWDPSEGQAEGSVTALVTNSGYGPATAGIQITAFYDVDLDGSFDPVIDSVLGVSHTTETLVPLEPLQIAVPIRGTLPFRDAPVGFEIDSQGHVPESDENNNLSPMSCQTKPWLGDDFDDGVADGWTQIPNQIGEVSSWEVADGVYRVEQGGGTWIGDLDWTDYSLRVRMRVPQSLRNDAGVLFRYQDPLNWYQFRFRDGLTRIIARIDGKVFADLVEAPVSMQADRWYTWRADVSGDAVHVYLDNLPVLSYQGLVLERGAVGFMNDGVTTYHDDLVVVPIVPSAGLADLTVSRPALLDNGRAHPPGVRVRVGNGGNGHLPAGAVLGFYAGEGALPQSLLQSVILGEFAPGTFADIELPTIDLDDGEPLSVAANPERVFAECSFENNLASSAYYAPQVPGQVTLSVAGGPFVAGQSVPLTVTVSNPGRFTGAYRLAVNVEDLRGGTAAELAADVPLVLAGGEVQDLVFTWPTAGLLEGQYQVQGVLRSGDNAVLDQVWQRIGLGAARGRGGAVAVHASTDRARYGEDDTVEVDVLIRNLTTTRLIPRATLQVQVEESSSATPFARSFDLGPLSPGSQVVHETQVSLAGVGPGTVTLLVEALEAGTGALLGSDTVEVEVASQSLGLVSGRVSLRAPVLTTDQEQTCVVQLRTRDTAPTSPLWLRVSVLDLVEGRPVWQMDDEILIGGGEIVESDQGIPADTLAQGVYVCVLQTGADGEWRTLDFATFRVRTALATGSVDVDPAIDGPDELGAEAMAAESADSPGDGETEEVPVDAALGTAAVQPRAVPSVSLEGLAILVFALGLLGSRGAVGSRCRAAK